MFDADLKLTCELPGGRPQAKCYWLGQLAPWCSLLCAWLCWHRLQGLPRCPPMRQQACAQAPPQSSSPKCCPQLTPAADHGQFDDSRPSKYGGNTAVTGEMGGLLRQAAALVGRKWKWEGGPASTGGTVGQPSAIWILWFAPAAGRLLLAASRRLPEPAPRLLQGPPLLQLTSLHRPS